MARAAMGAILPHAPLLLPDIARSSESAAIARVRDATREVARDLDHPVVLISPHAARSGVYVDTRADLAGFGLPGARARADVEQTIARDLAARWGRGLLPGPLDHGITVPLMIGPLAQRLVPVGLAEDGEGAVEDALALADAISALEPQVAVVASVNTGAGITARSPLTELSGAAELEHELREAVERDASKLLDIGPRLARVSRSCALGPLLVIAHLFAGRRLEVLAHEWPFGVGYLVARTQDPR